MTRRPTVPTWKRVPHADNYDDWIADEIAAFHAGRAATQAKVVREITEVREATGRHSLFDVRERYGR